MMLVAERIPEARDAVRRAKNAGRSVGFVPTMGALHAGHLSLIAAARKDGAFTVVSVFVNPTQFGPQEDFQRYPRPRADDLALCEQAGVDLVFYPAVDEMYPPGATTFVEVAGLSDIWEGAIRPGHFRGVATVVAKLFHIIPADRAFFGQKDYQQQLVIRRMVRDLNLPVEIVMCPTIRDPDGLALSSRNAYLTPQERQAGLSISRALFEAERAYNLGERQPRRLQRLMLDRLAGAPGLMTEYAAVVDPSTLVELEEPQENLVALIAARSGTTRLIDNAIFGEGNIEG
jgi:pantoate--beta-alanine ligase